MHHDVPLISTAAMAFVLACGFGFAAHWLRLPPLVGYLVAGIVIGPFSPGFVADAAMAGQLAEMGVILLMFGVGLHFSAADLLAVRWVAVPGAIGQIAVATCMGIGLALAWGWSLGAGLVLGLGLSVASTVVVLRALEDRNGLMTPNGRIAVGWLIVEDLVMVLTLVLLPALAECPGAAISTRMPQAPPAAATFSSPSPSPCSRWRRSSASPCVLGPKAVPWLLKQAARTGSRELFTLSVLALALGIAYGSAQVFGVSFALGAFFAGMVLNGTDFSHRAAADSLPLQDAFAILFFVAVGMLFDPAILVQQPLHVLAVLAVIVLGKSLAALAMVLALGFPAGTALAVAASLAQIGEFSFILAGLGVATGLLPDEGRDLVLAGALLSITLNPVVFAAADRLVAAGRSTPRLAWWFTDHGQARLAAVQAALDELHRRGEAREAERRLQIQQLVERFPIFADLDPQAWEDLLLLFRPRAAAPGERLIRAGDRAEAAYFIAAGAVAVSIRGGREIRLGPGEFFGEMALLSGQRRSADVTAVDYCQFMVLVQRDFRLFVSRHPQLRARLHELAQERTAMNRRENAV